MAQDLGIYFLLAVGNETISRKVTTNLPGNLPGAAAPALEELARP